MYSASMSRLSQLFTRRSARAAEPSGRASAAHPRRENHEHHAEFTRTRVSVEAYIDPPTIDQPTTILLIAADGEWTRRRVPDAAAARKLAAELGIPVYDVNFTGYPQRMRDWTSAQRRR